MSTETAARITTMHADMEETYADIYARYDDALERDDQDAADQISEEAEPYAVGVSRTVEVLLAGGAPSFRLFAVLDIGGTVQDVYTIASWFGEADVRTEVHDTSSALWRLAEQTAEYAIEGEDR